jgi:predicted ATP-dependent endonuclease of OLD family
MIRSVRIQGFRALKTFRMESLGRINLLISRNNTGKTSVLEGLYLLVTRGDPAAIWRVMTRRGEFLVPDTQALCYRSCRFPSVADFPLKDSWCPAV